jgi:hypothetical protein
VNIRPVITLISLALFACTAEPENGAVEEKRTSGPVPAAGAADPCDHINAEAARKAAAVEASDDLSDAEREIALVRIYGATGQCGMRPVPPGAPEPTDISDELAMTYRDAVEEARRFGADDGECRALVGSSKAAALEAICLEASGATHPPCNAANTCDLLVSEVDRNCIGDMARDYPKLCSAAHGDSADR